MKNIGSSNNRNWLSRRWYYCLLSAIITLVIWGNEAVAQSFSQPNNPSIDWLATIWMLIAAALVFFMNAGFAMLEAGFCRTRNSINVLAKNLIVFCVSALAYWLLGFGLMFGDGNGFLGQMGFLFEFPFPTMDNPQPFPLGFSQLQEAWPGRSFTALFFFQLVFAGTAATIISGAVAERIKFWAFLLFSFILVAVLYPLFGHWVWSSDGWIFNSFKFRDFAGSTVVHSVGGAAALVGAWLLKPRDGRFGYNLQTDKFEERETEIFLPHNLGFATLGCLILWLGWFGFNGGSVAYIESVPPVIATTMISAAAGGIFSLIFYPAIRGGKPQLASIMNGILGGLVGITASSAYVNIGSSVIVGGVSGMVVLLVEWMLEKLKIDDPVGAVPVHLGCGFWGTIAVGLFSQSDSLEYSESLFHPNILQQVFFQLFGWLTIIVFILISSFLTWTLIGYCLYLLFERANHPNYRSNFWRIISQGLRVSQQQERDGGDGTFEDPKLKYRILK